MPVKPTEQEEEYFARQEFERRKQLEEEKQQKLQEAERTKLRELHYMRCPKCGMVLIEIDHKSIKIDKCSHCDGVWLDAGELDAICELEQSRFSKLFKVFK